jgi:hypothetical protein
VFLHPVHDAVVGIRALVVALQSLPPLISRYAQSDSVLWAKFLQLGHDAGGDDGRGFGIEQVHEGFVELELAVHGVGKEVRVDEDGIGRTESGVGLEEERRGDLWAVMRQSQISLHGGEGNDVHLALGLALLLLLLCCDLACHLVLLATLCVSTTIEFKFEAHCRIQSSIALACDMVSGHSRCRLRSCSLTNDALDLRKLACVLLNSHIGGVVASVVCVCQYR